MKKMPLILICLLSCGSYLSNAQNASFLFSGTIEYEKKVNMHARIRQMIGPNAPPTKQQAYENYERTQPKFDVFKSNLLFTSTKTLFQPVQTSVNRNALFFGPDPMASQPNLVYADHRLKRNSIQKDVFNETFLLKDSLPKIVWKLVDETRDIAGYTCRRANGLIMDSVYVVAFYSEEIRVSSGPESFSGLPGMILGVALPYEHITWFATMVTPKPAESLNIAEPSKGSVISRVEFKDLLNSRFRNDPETASTLVKVFMF